MLSRDPMIVSNATVLCERERPAALATVRVYLGDIGTAHARRHVQWACSAHAGVRT